jgi:hypothetical protein
MEDQEQEGNMVDVITVDVPLFIRLLEFAREDATDDMKLHSVTEKLTELCQDGDIMTMEQYDDIVGDTVNGADTSGMNAVEDKMHPQNKDMNTIDKQRWMKLAGIINENTIFADYAPSGENDGIEVKLARNLSEAIYALEMNEGTIDGLFSAEMEEYEEGNDDFYANKEEALKAFTSLPFTFTITNNIDGDEGMHEAIITKTGPESWKAKIIK